MVCGRSAVVALRGLSRAGFGRALACVARMVTRARLTLCSAPLHSGLLTNERNGAMPTSEECSVTIELGNAEMREPEHVGDALHDIAETVASGYTSGIVLDVNGNTVGSFSVSYPDDAS